MRFVNKIQKREMDNYTYGEVFEREAPRASRPTRSVAQYRISYNEYLKSPNIEGDDGDVHPSTFPGPPLTSPLSFHSLSQNISTPLLKPEFLLLFIAIF
jgi:hypothetical protein